MNCASCGAKLKGSEAFCPQCGATQRSMAELVDLAKQGDEQAISDLYGRTYNAVYASVKAKARVDEDTVLDVIQDAYVKGFQSLDQLQNPEQFQAWMKTIAMNRLRDVLKKNRPTLFSELSPEDEDTVIDFEDERIENLPDIVVDRQETARLIGEILDSLTDEQRMAVVLYYYEELSVKEIANLLECSENTVKSRLNYARKKIKLQVEDLERRGTKLYGLAPLPFLLLLLHNAEIYGPSLYTPAAAAAGGAGAGAGTAAAQNVAGTTASGATGAASGATGTAAGAAGAGLVTKIVAGALAVVLAAGGGAGAARVLSSRQNPSPAAVETTGTTSQVEEAEAKRREEKAEKERPEKAEQEGPEAETEKETPSAEAQYQEELKVFQPVLDEYAEINTDYVTYTAKSDHLQYANGYSLYNDESYFPEGKLKYTLYDITGDGNRDLIVAFNNCEGDALTYRYTPVAIYSCNGKEVDFSCDADFDVCMDDGFCYSQDDYDDDIITKLRMDLDGELEVEEYWTFDYLDTEKYQNDDSSFTREEWEERVQDHDLFATLSWTDVEGGMRADSAKEAYREYLSQCRKNAEALGKLDIPAYRDTLTTYTFFDLDGDGAKELIVEVGNSEATYHYRFLTYRDGKLVLLGVLHGGHSSLALDKKGALIVQNCHMGHETDTRMTVKDGRLFGDVIYDKDTHDYREYQKRPKEHLYDYSSEKLDLSEL